MKAYEYFRSRIVPELRYSQWRYEELLDQLVTRDCRWLDLGCGHGVLPSWRRGKERELVDRASRAVGIDLDWAGLLAHETIEARVYGDAGGLPFADGSFDLVSANMVVEHLQNPTQQFREIARVLRPGGKFIFLTPNARGYLVRLGRAVPEFAKPPLVRLLERRAAQDVFPTYYRANTVDAIAALSAAAQLEVHHCERLTTVPQFARVLPLAVVELAFIRLLSRERLSDLRPNIVAVLARA